MLIIKGKDKTIEFKVTFSKANKFCKEHLTKEQTLLDVFTTQCMSNEALDFLLTVIHEFQAQEKSLKKTEIENLLDDYLSEEENDILELYGLIAKEFDLSGVIKKGMGFTMMKKVIDSMEEMKEKIMETNLEEMMEAKKV